MEDGALELTADDPAQARAQRPLRCGVLTPGVERARGVVQEHAPQHLHALVARDADHVAPRLEHLRKRRAPREERERGRERETEKERER